MRFEPVFEKRVTRSIEDWLSQLGLARYAEAFVAAEIDVDVLAELTDGDLVSLGVTLGDRKRILRAGAAKTTAAAIPEPRQSTVVYCDLVDATDLAVRLDPRELRAVMAAYHARCADVVSAHGGEAQYLGAGVTVTFRGGLGDAEAAERATSCAIALLAAIGALSAGRTNLQTRIGIATGSEAGQATPSLAARLQRLAEPGSVLIADTTRRLLGDAFTLTPAAERAVAGLAERGEAWRVELARGSAPPEATSTVGDAAVAVTSTAPQTPAEPPHVENHFEDGGEPLAALRYWQGELERAERQHDPHLGLEALHACWTIAFSIGDLSYTLDATARGVALYDAAYLGARQTPVSGHDASVCAAGYRALALLLCGRIREGRGWLRRVETALARFEHPPTRCTGQLVMASARDVLGEFDLAIALANEARKLATKHRFARSLLQAACISAAARIGMGDRIAGMRALDTALDEPCALAAGWRPYYLVRLALARIDAGDDGTADVRLANARTIAHDRGGCIAMMEIERATAALLRLRASPAYSVTERFENALQLARAQLATLLELRAACDAYEYALAFSGKAAAAASMHVRGALERIDGGETTADVRRARALERRAAATH